jgi:type IV pilus assembly protein PilA
MAIFKKAKRGFTLVELMIVVAIVGVLAALAIYGVRKYMLNAKTAEARQAIGRLARDAASAFNREQMDAKILALGGVTGNSNRFCGSAGKTVPATPDSIKGLKYQSDPAEWNDVNQLTGWQCLRFTMQDPQYYMYGYAASGTAGTPGESFTASAEGDLDGDTARSRFELSGLIQPSGN